MKKTYINYLGIFIFLFCGSKATYSTSFHIKDVSLSPSGQYYYEKIIPLDMNSNAILWGIESPIHLLYNNDYTFEINPAIYFLGSYTVNSYPIDMDKRRQMFFQLSGLIQFFNFREISFSGGPMYMYTGKHYYDGDPEPSSSYSDLYLKLKTSWKKPFQKKLFFVFSLSFALNLTPGREVLRYIYEDFSMITSISSGIGYHFP